MHGWRGTLQKHWISGAAIIFAILVLFGLLFLCIILLPNYLVQRSVGHLASQLSISDRLSAQNDIRTTLIQALGGTLVLLGATIGATVTLRQVAVNREGQITDRFTNAVDQLGQEAVDVRVGGIYALERIAKNSISDRDAIFDILSQFIRRSSSQAADNEPYTGNMLQVYSEKALRIRKANIQAALTVITRPPLSDKVRFVALDRLDIRGIMLPNANLSRMSLVGVLLDGSWLRNSDFEEASLSLSQMRKCVLVQANLRGCNLNRADLTEANLQDADLRDASLIGTDLTEADLTGADLRGATASRETHWPRSVTPSFLGVIVIEPKGKS